MVKVICNLSIFLNEIELKFPISRSFVGSIIYMSVGNVNNRPDKLGTFIRLPVALQNQKNDQKQSKIEVSLVFAEVLWLRWEMSIIDPTNLELLFDFL